MNRSLARTGARAALLVLLAVVAIAAGCGGSGSSGSSAPADNGVADKSADQIVAAAIAAAQSAKSVRITASGTSNGQPLHLDLQLVGGQGGMGSITVNGLAFQMVRIGDKAYFKADASFWSNFGSGAATQLLAGRWIESSATAGKLASFTPLTDLGGYVSKVLSSHGALKKGSAATVNGLPSISITDTTQGGTLWVSTTGKPYPLKLAGGSSDSTALFLLEDWDQPVTLTTPPNPIDLNSLSGG